MKIGDKVKYNGVACRLRSRTQVSFTSLGGNGEGIYIGWVDRYEGKVVFTNAYDEGNYFEQQNSVRLLRIQPVDSSGRWRKPIECFPDQIVDEGIQVGDVTL